MQNQIEDSSQIEEIIESGNLIKFIESLSESVQKSSVFGECLSRYAKFCIEHTKFDQYKLIFQLYKQKFGEKQIVNLIKNIRQKLFEQHRFKIIVYTIQQFPPDRQTNRTEFLNKLLFYSTIQDKYTSMRYLLQLGADPQFAVEKSSALQVALQKAEDKNDRKLMNLILMKAKDLELSEDQKLKIKNYEPKWYNSLFTQSILQKSSRNRINSRKYIFCFLILLNSTLWMSKNPPCLYLSQLLFSWATINLILHIYLCLVNPGLKKLEIDVDPIIMSDIDQDQICLECKRLVEKSTIHCDRCQVCVEDRSHHCIWIDRCVGQSNKYAFRCSLFMFSVYFLASPIFATYLMFQSQNGGNKIVDGDLVFRIAIMSLGYLITIVQIIQYIRIKCDKRGNSCCRESKKRTYDQNTNFDTSQLINNDNVN